MGTGGKHPDGEDPSEDPPRATRNTHVQKVNEEKERVREEKLKRID